MSNQLPVNTEMWLESVTHIDCPHCGQFSLPHDSAYATSEVYCPSCERLIWTLENGSDSDPRSDAGFMAWWFWFCFPGCLPDSSVFGPYTTREEAIDAARDYAGGDDDDETDDSK